VPLQIVVLVEVNPVGAVGAVCTVIAAVTPPVWVVQAVFPTLRTQYVVVAVGDTDCVVVNVPAAFVPTVAPVPYWKYAPEPTAPPLGVKVTAEPEHIVVVDAPTEVGAVGAVCTVIVAVTPPVAVVQLVFPTLRTQYVVVAVGDTDCVVVNVPTAFVPTVAPVPYWKYAPEPTAPPLGDKVTAEPEHIVVVDAPTEVGAVGGVCTVIVPTEDTALEQLLAFFTVTV
jgi:hypothetical protein